MPRSQARLKISASYRNFSFFTQQIVSFPVKISTCNKVLVQKKYSLYITQPYKLQSATLDAERLHCREQQCFELNVSVRKAKQSPLAFHYLLQVMQGFYSKSQVLTKFKF